jgi:hypothetical protein
MLLVHIVYKIYAHKENNRHTENVLGMYFHSFIV